MKKISFLSLALVAMVFIVYKRKKINNITNEKVLRLELSAAPVSLDPTIADDYYSVMETSKVYEGLLEYHYLERPLQIVPLLAESMPEVSSDELTYTFKIKKNVFFQDNACFKDGKGRELIAEDFVFAIKRVADPKIQSSLFAFFDDKIIGLNEWREKNSNNEKVNYDEEVEGIKTIDKYTLQFKLKKKWPQFMHILTMPHCVAIPKEAVIFHKENFGRFPVGTGPFIIKEYNTSENKIIAYKNPKYREVLYPSSCEEELKKKGLCQDAGKKLPFLDRIETYIIKEAQPRWLKFLSKDIDIIDLRGMTDLNRKIIQEKAAPELLEKGIIFSKEAKSATTMLYFNTNIAPFKDNKYLRQAISCALDRDKVNELFYDSRRIKANGIIPKGLEGYQENFENPYLNFDKEKAKKLLEKAGYKDGKNLFTLDLIVSEDMIGRSFGEFFKNSMKEIGININLKICSWAEKVNSTNSGQYHMHTGGWVADYPDAENFFSLFYKGQYKEYSGYSDKDFDNLYEIATKMPSCEERNILYNQLNKKLAEDVPAAALHYESAMHMYFDYVKNFNYFDPTRSNFFKYIDIDMKKKIVSNCSSSCNKSSCNTKK
jgi:oligopeptide transport system substrate-binding protein